MANSKTKKPAKKTAPPRKAPKTSKRTKPAPKIAKAAATKVARGGAALARPTKKPAPAAASPRRLVTKRLISKRLAREVERAEPALRRGKPEVSSFGHAKHVQGPEAKLLRSQLLMALSKGPRSFESLEAAFPMITENQLRYQLVILRTSKMVRKVGAREATVYELLPAKSSVA